MQLAQGKQCENRSSDTKNYTITLATSKSLYEWKWNWNEEYALIIPHFLFEIKQIAVYFSNTFLYFYF